MARGDKNKNKPASQEDVDKVSSDVSEDQASDKLRADVSDQPKRSVRQDISKHSKFDKFKKGSN